LLPAPTDQRTALRKDRTVIAGREAPFLRGTSLPASVITGLAPVIPLRKHCAPKAIAGPKASEAKPSLERLGPAMNRENLKKLR
jgi:hypothetical protein